MRLIKEVINRFADHNNFDCCSEINNLIKNTNIDIGVVIVWNNKYNNKIIEEIIKISNDIDLIYSKKIETTLKFTENLLREIQMKKPWWDKNLKGESKKRYNESLTFHIFKGENLHTIFRSIKNTIRKKNNFQKNIFHFSDPDCPSHIGIKCHCKSERHIFLTEVYKHINLLMNTNTLHFLKNSNYNKNFNIHKYFDEYCEYISKNRYNDNNFIIDNGGVLALYGLRDSHDIDFVTTENNIKCNQKNVDCMNHLHINEFKKLNLDIKTIINNPEYHFYHYNKKILDIKILKKFKYNRTQNIVRGQSKIREKDINDYKMICEKLL